ncbi:unnamed protein product [Closterium sp. NIES-65]|nr:unnamed protein product [Closterium sp. NIES-65]
MTMLHRSFSQFCVPSTVLLPLIAIVAFATAGCLATPPQSILPYQLQIFRLDLQSSDTFRRSLMPLPMGDETDGADGDISSIRRITSETSSSSSSSGKKTKAKKTKKTKKAKKTKKSRRYRNAVGATAATSLVAKKNTGSRGKAQATQGDSFLHEAIASANEKAGSAVKVVLSADVTLTSNLPQLEYNAILHIQGKCGGKRCVIKGNGFKGFNCDPGAALQLEDLHIEGFTGGAIIGECSGVGLAKPLIARRVTFRGNSNTRGGAISQELATIQISECLFENNQASLDGGAISLLRSGFLAIFNSTFVNNVASGGYGGAVAGQVNYVQRSRFEGNSAKLNGGAIYSTAIAGQAPSIMRTSFQANVARTGGGGALFVGVEGGGSAKLVTRVCYSSFAKNSAVSPTASDDILVDGVEGGGNVLQLCSNQKPDMVAQQPNAQVVQSCKGCSGCGDGDDCNGKGKCIYDKVDGTPSCKCQGSYSKAASCATCELGYSLASDCNLCMAGFIPVTTSSRSSSSASSTTSSAAIAKKGTATNGNVKCKTCPALKAISDLDVYRIIGGARVSTQAACADMCASSRNIQTYEGDKLSCESWVWIPKGSPGAAKSKSSKSTGSGSGGGGSGGKKKGVAEWESECAGFCVMRHTDGACSNGTAVLRTANGYSYYVGSFDDGSCQA